MKKNEYEKMYLLENSHFWFVGKRFFIKTYLDKIKTPVREILDLGSGTGATTKFLSGFGNVVGLEKNPLAVSLAKKRGVKIISGDILALPFRNQTFDLVTVFDVLYHKNIRNVDETLAEIYRVLKPGGYLLITDSAFNFLKGKHGLRLDEARRFTLTSLKKSLSSKSYRTYSSSYIFITLLPLIFLKRKVVDKLSSGSSSDVFKIPSLINCFLLILLRVEAGILKYVKIPFGTSLIILAQKI